MGSFRSTSIPHRAYTAWSLLSRARMIVVAPCGSLDLGCKRRMAVTMSAAYKVNQSRQRWQQKAKRRAKQAEAQLGTQRPASPVAAIESKILIFPFDTIVQYWHWFPLELSCNRI